MAAGMIEKMQGISTSASSTATTPTFRHMPPNLGPNAVVATLQALGLNIPTQLAAAAAKGEALRTAKSKYRLEEIDAALSKAGVPLSDRFRFKAALDHNGLLGS